MYCDALTLAAIADELRNQALGGRVQQALLVDRYVIGLEIYASRRQYLLLSARPDEGGRVHLTSEKLRRGLESPSPLLLRLRKEICGSRLTDIAQPPLERILRLTFESSQGSRVLVIEVMGQRSNIVLLEEDSTILECSRRVLASQNRYRVLLPGQAYVPPPAQQKADARALTVGRLNELLRDTEAGMPLWKKFVATLRGVSPLLAREVIYRASGDPQSAEANFHLALSHLQELLSLPTTCQWRPCVAGPRERLAAFAPYELTHYPEHRPYLSISAAAEAFYAQRVGADAYAVAKQRVANLIQEQRERQLHKQEALLAANPTSGVVEELRSKGEALLAYAHEIKPRQMELRVQWDEGQPALHIDLDPNLSAVENAREYFKRYDKAKSASAEVPALLHHVDGELEYLDQLSTDLALAEDRPGIAAVENALAVAGFIPRPRKMQYSPAALPLRILSAEGFVILVGRNSWQNEQVTFHHSVSHDMWLHAHRVPGSHVVIHTAGEVVPESTLCQAAELAAYYSAARQDTRVWVDYTLRRNVRRRRGGRQGQVAITGEKSLAVQPRRDEEP